MEKNLNEDTLIISAAAEDRIEPLTALNIQDLISELDLGKFGLNSIDTSNMNSTTAAQSSYQYSTAINSVSSPLGTINIPTINSAGTSGYPYNSNITHNPWITSTYNNGALQVNGDAEFEGDIKWKGRSLGEMLSKIERRLSILVPDPEKLEHFEALKKAYEHYKTLEALCEVPKKEDDK